MFHVARRVLAIYAAVALVGAPAQRAEAVEAPPLVSRRPSITFVGGAADRRETVVVAVARFVESGLALPDLEVHLHEGRESCRDLQGMFRPSGDKAVIDLCYEGEFLALHELGHAWEHFNLGADDRARFEQLTGATTWRSTEVVWGRRGAEITANTLAHGLLSTRLHSAAQHAVDFERFLALTGIPSPRLAELEPETDAAPVMSDTERVRLAAYSAWRDSNS
jgi:hypothetical protein